MSFPVPAGGAMMMPTGAPEPDASAQQGILPSRPVDAVDYTVRGMDGTPKGDALARKICAEISNYRAATERRRNNQLEWKRSDRMLPDYPTTEDSEEFDWHSASRAPLSRMARQNHTTRLNGQILTGAKPFGVVGKKATVQTPEGEFPLAELQGQIEDALTALLDEADWKGFGREVHRLLPRDGSCLAEVVWKTETSWAPVVGLNFDEEAPELLMEAGMDPEQAMLEAVEKDADGLAKVELQFEERVCEGIELNVIEASEAILLPATAKRRKDLWGLGKKFVLRGMDLKAGVASGKYLKRNTKELLGMHGDAPDEDAEADGEFTGVDTGDGTSYPDDPLWQPYNCAELCVLGNFDGKKQLKWYIVGVSLEREKLIRCQYMPYEHGRSYYVPFSYIEDTITGESVIELLAVLQDVATRALNDFVDITRQISAQGTSLLTDSTSGLDVDNTTLTLGSVVEVGNINGIRDFPVHPAAGAALGHLMALLNLLKDWSDLLTASSNPALGKESQGDNTLGEVQIVMDATSQIFNDHAVLVSMRHAEVADQVRWLAAQYASDGQVPYRKTAEGGFSLERIPKEVLLADVDLVPSSLGTFTDDKQRLQRDMLVLSTTSQHPLTQTNWELQARVLTQFLEDAKFPGWQLLKVTLEQQAVQMRLMERMQAAMAMQQAGQQQQVGATQQRMAEEKHQDERQGAALGRVGQVKELMTPPDAPKNGKAKK